MEISSEKVKKIWVETFTKDSSLAKIHYREYIILVALTNLGLIAAVLLLSYFKKLPPQIPLFYGKAEGEAQLAVNWQLALPSLVSIVFLSLNCALAYFLKDEFLKKTLIIGVFALTILSIVTTIEIVTQVANL